MNKKSIVILILFVICAIGFSACTTQEKTSDHKCAFTEYVYNEDATCTKDGTETAECGVCGKKDTRTKPNSAGHKFVNHTCTVCGTSDHKCTFTDYVYNQDATCTKDGTETAECGVCGKKDTRTKPNSAEHKFVNYFCDICGSYDPEYIFSAGLAYTEIKENDIVTSYSLDGKGTCDSADIVIPGFYKGKPVVKISSKAFSSSNITSITIPETITSIGENAFYNCYDIQRVYVSSIESLCSISFANEDARPGGRGGAELYVNNKLLTKLIIPETVTAIKSYAFCGCIGLTEVIVPDNVKGMGFGLFKDCDSLESLTLPFLGSSYYNEHLGYIFGADTNSQNRNYVPSTLKTVVITGGTEIGSYAFYECAFLTNIELPDSLTYIGSYAFSGCTALKFNEYDNGLYLGNADNPYLAFIKGKRTTIASCEINENVKLIAATAFNGYNNLRSIKIPDSIVKLGSRTFYGCSALTRIELPNKINLYESYIFGECTGLEEIAYNGTSEQWEAVKKSDTWNYKTGNYSVICTDATLEKSES